MNIEEMNQSQSFLSDYGPLEVQLLKGDSLMFLQSKDGYLDLANTRILDTPLATTILSANDGEPLFFSRTTSSEPLLPS